LWPETIGWQVRRAEPVWNNEVVRKLFGFPEFFSLKPVPTTWGQTFSVPITIDQRRNEQTSMRNWLALPLLVAAFPLAAEPNFQTLIEMRDRGASTYYVDVHMTGASMQQFLVDTGSSYTTVNENTLAELLASDQAEYLRNLEGVLADGSKQILPVYTIKSLSIGASCRLGAVQVVVFPGDTRNILGLNALRDAAPFIFSVDPPTLTLSNCHPDQAMSGSSSIGAGAPM
jgi:predicted aspartyl protease